MGQKTTTPKIWPKTKTYANESVSPALNLAVLRHFLHTTNTEDVSKISQVIEEKRIHPHLQLQKITPSFKIDGERPHPLGCQKTQGGLVQYGLFATEDIQKGSELGEYVGEISLISHAECLQAMQPSAVTEYVWLVMANNLCFKIDAQTIANELAFINDYRGISSAPNVVMRPLIHRGVYYFGYVASCDLSKGQELLIDYGPLFEKWWQSKDQNFLPI